MVEAGVDRGAERSGGGAQMNHLRVSHVRTRPRVNRTAKETASRITETAIDLSRSDCDAM